MKKIVSFILTLTMVMSLSVMTVFAAVNASGESDSADVTGTYAAGGTAAKVYSVDISWSGLDFTYNGASQGTWNPDTHTYDGATEAGWAEGSGTITITNHSNTDITATPFYTAKQGYESADMSFDHDNLVITTADNGENGENGVAVSDTITVTPTGELPEATNNATIGTITITID